MSQDFFFSRLGTWILRTDPNDDKARTYFLSKPEDPAKEYDYVSYYHSLQDIGVKFAPLLVIHSSESKCVSCEG